MTSGIRDAITRVPRNGFDVSDASGPRLLSGGNPQIPKGDGDEVVQAYIAAMPEWKQEIGRSLDRLVETNVAEIKKAVRWNSPFYGLEGLGWFLSFHCFTRYVKVTFLNGAHLDPLPPVGSKDPDARYVHLDQDSDLTDPQLAAWIRQASQLPSWEGF